MMETLEDRILVNLLALDDLFQNYEFIHCYLGPLKYRESAIKISPNQALKNIKNLSSNLVEITDVYPFYRRTFITELLQSVIKQVDVFCDKVKKQNFQDLIQTLIGTTLVSPFNLDIELNDVNNYIKKTDFKNIPSFLMNREKIYFNTIKELEKFIYDYIYEIIAKMDKIYSKRISVSLSKLMDNIDITIEESKIKHLPCYYFYKGERKGVVGITLKNELNVSYIKSFILHEIVPGHHFYYLMKQSDIDNNQICDSICFIDTFYSPENTVNEGLAVNAEIILDNQLDNDTIASIKLEKLVHKILYNAWYAANIYKKNNLGAFKNILQNEIGFDSRKADEKLKYYIDLEKYYVASYPIGAEHVQKIIKQIGKKNIYKLYKQHSVKTLNLMMGEELK